MTKLQKLIEDVRKGKIDPIKIKWVVTTVIKRMD